MDDPQNPKLRIDHVRGPVTCSPESTMENDNFKGGPLFSLHVSFGGFPYSILNLGRVDYNIIPVKLWAIVDSPMQDFQSIHPRKIDWKWRFPIGIPSSMGSIFRFHASFLGSMASYTKSFRFKLWLGEKIFLFCISSSDSMLEPSTICGGPMFCVKSHEPHTPAAETPLAVVRSRVTLYQAPWVGDTWRRTWGPRTHRYSCQWPLDPGRGSISIPNSTD